MSKLKTLIVLVMTVAPAVLSAEPTQSAAGYQPTVELQACCRVYIGGAWYCISC